jgi:Fe-S cluster assembly protein SufD
LIIVGKHAKLSYLERFESLGKDNVKNTANIAVEVIALEARKLSFQRLIV